MKRKPKTKREDEGGVERALPFPSNDRMLHGPPVAKSKLKRAEPPLKNESMEDCNASNKGL